MRRAAPARAVTLARPIGQRGIGDILALARGWVLLWAEQESRNRTGFLWLPVAFGLGILVYFQAPEEPAFWAGPVLALAAGLASWRLAGLARVSALALCFMALGFSAANLRQRSVASPMLERDIVAALSGFIEEIEMFPRRHRLVLRVTSVQGLSQTAQPFRVRIGIAGRAAYRAGDFVHLRARLSPPSDAALPGGYDVRFFSYFRGIGGVGFALGRPKIESAPMPAPASLWVFARIDRMRNALTTRIATTIGGEAGALAAALVTGKRGLIPETANDDLRAAGLYHIVSISGLHMVLAAGVLFWLIRAGLAGFPGIALHYPIKKIAALGAMVGATGYCLFSGSEVATERSLIMTLVMLGAIQVDRPALAMRNLAIAALLVLAREPESLLGPSFQMSFAAVAALMAANQIWQDRRRTTPPAERGPLHHGTSRLWLGFLAIGATTLVATIATAPFSVYHFHRLNPFGLIGNALAIPLVSLLVMPAAVAGTILLPFGLDSLVWTVMGEGVRGILLVAAKVATLDGAVYPVPPLSALAFCLQVVAMLVFVALRTPLRWFSLPLLGLWLLFVRASPLPDLIIDPGGRLVLLRGESGALRLLAAGGAHVFTLSQWLPALGDARHPRDMSLRAGTQCDRTGCNARLGDGRRVALSLTPATLREDCQRAQIIVTPLRAGGACPPDRRVLDRAHFERFGATRAYSPQADTWRLETTLDPTHRRPWRRALPPAFSLGNAGIAPKPGEASHRQNSAKVEARTIQAPTIEGPISSLASNPATTPQPEFEGPETPSAPP